MWVGDEVEGCKGVDVIGVKGRGDWIVYVVEGGVVGEGGGGYKGLDGWIGRVVGLGGK